MVDCKSGPVSRKTKITGFPGRLCAVAVDDVSDDKPPMLLTTLTTTTRTSGLVQTFKFNSTAGLGNCMT